MSGKIFIVEDEPDMTELLEEILKREGYQVFKFYSGVHALKEISIKKPDLILLDLMLPDMSGLQICKKLSDNEETSNIPVIILTSRNDEYDILNSFDFGCSDYVTKPFNEKILVARIKACLSLRKKLCYSKGYGYDDKKIIKFNTLSIDPSRYEVKIKNKLIDLTPLEFKLFYFLAKNQEKVFNRDQIYEEIYENDLFRGDRSIDILINRIRKKLGTYGEKLETIYGVGYKFNANNNAE